MGPRLTTIAGKVHRHGVRGRGTSRANTAYLVGLPKEISVCEGVKLRHRSGPVRTVQIILEDEDWLVKDKLRRTQRQELQCKQTA